MPSLARSGLISLRISPCGTGVAPTVTVVFLEDEPLEAESLLAPGDQKDDGQQGRSGEKREFLEIFHEDSS